MSYAWRVGSGLAGVLVALTAISAPCRSAAQTAYAPPIVSSVDSNDVNLVTGQMSVITHDLQIGGSGSGLTRNGYGYGAPYSDNFTGFINNDGSGNLTVSMGSASDKFNLVSGAYQSVSGSSNTLSCNSTDCYYTLADGTVADFSLSLTSSIGISANYGTLVSITKPDGEVISLTYRSTTSGSTTTRYLLTVSSTLGWMLKYHVSGDNPANYVPVKIEAINTSVDYCGVSDLACTAETVSWPYVMISTSGPTDALGHQTVFNGGMAAPTSIVSPNGVTKTISYYSSGTYAGRVYQVTVGTSTWTYAYSLSGTVQTTTVTDPNSGVHTLTYDTSAYHVLSDTDPLGRTTKYTYYTSTGSGAFSGAVYQVINPDATYSGSTLTGGYTQYSYDGRGNITTVSRVPNGGGTPLTRSATYVSSCTNIKTCDKPLTTTDEANVTTTYTYDPNSGNVATATLPAVGGVSPQTRYTYSQVTPNIKNSAGTLVAQPPVWRQTLVSTCMSTSSCSGTSDEKKTITVYGTNNVQPITVTLARGDANLSASASSTNEYRTTTYTYDNFGNVASVDGPIAGNTDTSYYFYDVLNRKIGEIGPDPDDTGPLGRQGTIVAYNNDGQVSSTTNGSVSGTTWSALNAMTVRDKTVIDYSTTTGFEADRKFYPGTAGTPQNIVQTAYDSLLRVNCVANRMNAATFSSLPDACTAATAGADGPDRIVKYNYDAADQLLSQVSGYNVTPRNDFVKTYNASGTVATAADDHNNLTTYSYDNFNRLVKVCYPNPSTTGVSSATDCDQVTYSGAVVYSLVLRDGKEFDFTYDADNRLYTVANAASETYGYDNFNHVTTHTANSVTENFTYDALNGMLSDAQPAGTVTYGYDPYGRRSQLNYPAYGGVPFYVAYGYLNDNSLQNERTAYNSGTQVVRAGFTEDSFGRSSTLSLGPSSQVTSTPAYDTSSRLSSLTNTLAGSGNNAIWGYSYNLSDQIKTRTQSGSTAYNYVAPAASSISYTTNGLNQVSPNGLPSFGYDGRGNLTSDGSTSYGYNAYNMLTSVGTATLSYDASNRLASLVKSATTKFLYDGDDLIAEYDGSGTLLRRYVHGPGTDRPLVWFEGTDDSTPRYLTADQQGSITAVTDGNGNMLAINTYNEYGLPLSTNNTYQSRFGYTGQVYLPEVALYNYKARMYAPTIGRFLQTDPIGYGNGMNRYAYVGNDPVNRADPTGKLWMVTGTYCPSGGYPIWHHRRRRARYYCRGLCSAVHVD
jgi:RHS repeat-associated protein